MRSARQRVLVVDDKPAVRQMVADVLREEGFEVVEATNGVEALWRLKSERMDAAVLDLRMPRLGGLEALRRIRALDPGLKVVIMTSYPEAIREQAASLGAAAVLAKPFEMRELLQALGSETTPTAVPGQSTAPSAASGRAAPAAGRTPKILVVEDDPHTGAMLNDFVLQQGYEAQWVTDGVAALRALTHEAPDLVLLDILMPGLSGVEALPSIRAVAPGVPVIMASGTADEELARQALALGAFDYVVKPVDLHYLAESIELALALIQVAQD
jgi:two-component system response regulator (stage 0 sporulation protein F)